MPFTPRSQTTNHPSGQYQKDPNEPPLLRLGGLYTSQSGKAIMGNIFVAEPRRPREGEPPTDVPFGEVLIDMIRQCMEEGRPLRFLVFEGRGNSKAPYSLNVTLGAVRTPAQQEQRKEAPRVAQQANQGGPWVPQVPLPENEDEEGDNEPEPEPTPRPVRRVAPRR